MEKTLKLNKTYDIIISAKTTDRPKGHVYIKFQSRWSGAVDPEGLQKRFDITLSEAHALELCKIIQEVINNE